ncbi:hypothetical protein [Tissierella sp.]|uniref:hypothetical protein n=1 Tax=Tissierella sp. TaxID=41274 RepID=UPI00286E5867|nr:hypothetical protein [Tissierella sp.]
MILVRKVKSEILMDRLGGDKDTNRTEVIASNILEEYDVTIVNPNKIYIVYQNKDMHLILVTIKDSKIEEIQLTVDPILEVFDLNILTNNNTIHIVYQTRISVDEQKYYINHHYYDGNKWFNYTIDEITAQRALNPFKLIGLDDKLLLSYYKSSFTIELKEFSFSKLEWSDGIKLVDTPTEKLFLDMLKIDEYVHLSYCQFIDGNLVVKYERLSFAGGIEQNTEIISNEGSPSYPTIIFYEDKLWITWVESNKVLSRYSGDRGQSWESVYMWNSSRSIDFLRYKYLTIIPEKDVILNHSFGKVSPDIEFIGFGSTANALEIPLKKKKFTNPIRI